MKNSIAFNFWILLICALMITACEPEPLEEVISTTVDNLKPNEDQAVVFLDPFPEVKIHCGEQEEGFYKNESGKDQTVTVMGTDKCLDFDSMIELQKEEVGDDGKIKIVKIKEMDIPDGKSRVKTWVVKDGQFLSFYCEGTDETGACSWVIAVK